MMMFGLLVADVGVMTIGVIAEEEFFVSSSFSTVAELLFLPTEVG